MEQLLNRLPVCSLCASRLLGKCGPTDFETPASSSLSNSSTGTCGLCVGMLQAPAVNSVKTSLDSQLASYVYPADEPWSLNLSIPVATAFRGHVLAAIFQRDGVPEALRRNVIDLKFACKSILSPIFQEAFTKHASNSMENKKLNMLGFKISLDVSFPAMDKHEDMDPLFPNPRSQRGGKGKKRRRCNTEVVNHQSLGRMLEGLDPAEMARTLGTGRDELEKFLVSPPEKNDFDVDKLDQFLMMDCKVEREALFILGRYNKYSRELTQTPWVLDGERKTPDSVEELVANPLIKAFGCTNFKFHSAGREDVDVRMLGNGRDFVVEMFDPHTPCQASSLKELENDVARLSDGRVTINSLVETDKSVMMKLHRAAEQHRKVYAAVVWTEKVLTTEEINKFNSTKEIEVKQKTPIRVLHRRPNAIRDKSVLWVEFVQDKDQPNFGILRLETSAGTYIKEFCHGDLGRTLPNLGSLLGCKADILYLDVENLLEDDNLKQVDTAVDRTNDPTLDVDPPIDA